jgi:ubiquinone/menaquinone biosynthesis C-methylase UbiE
VRDPPRVISEIQRVLKPGGKFMFIEHVRSHSLPLRILQDVLTPLQTVVADGCHFNRRTDQMIREHGSQFSEIKIEQFEVTFGFGTELISSQICGHAIKRA